MLSRSRAVFLLIIAAIRYLRPPCPTSFVCGIGCIASSLVCDNKPDCFDGSDESDCLCPDDGFRCSQGLCIAASKVCDGFHDCDDKRDEKPSCNSTSPTEVLPPGPQRRSRIITGIISGVIIFIVIMMFAFLLWFKCRNMKKNAGKSIKENGHVTWQLTNLPGYTAGSVSDASVEHSQSLDTYLSCAESQCSDLSYYDRNHVTGASSSSAISAFTHLPMNPPPSPMTERALSTITETNALLNVDDHRAMNCERCMQQIIEAVPVDMADAFLRHSAPPPTPASTTVADATDIYLPLHGPPRPVREKFCSSCRSVSSQRTRKSRPSRARHNAPFVNGNASLYFSDDFTTCSEYEPLHRTWQDTDDPTANYDESTFAEFGTHLHFAPPPTPCTNYMSEVTYASDEDDAVRPPSPANTEQSVATVLRSFYAPPPSPTSQLL